MPPRPIESVHPPDVRGLAWTSLCTDVSSKMVRAVEPLFLVDSIGLGRDLVALLEGIANATDVVLRWASGRWSDRLERRKPLTLAGYVLSTCARPLLALAGSTGTVALAKAGDRAGAGLRKAPRNAWLADTAQAHEVPSHTVFVYQKAMDHTGGAAGMLFALALLAVGLAPRGIVAVSVLPALVGLVVLSRIREPAWHADPPPDAPGPAMDPDAGADLVDRRALRSVLLLGAALGFANVSEKLFVIRAADAAGGLSEHGRFLYGAGCALSVFAASALVGGSLQRRLGGVGARTVVAAGLGAQAVVFVGFMLVRLPPVLAVALFAVKGTTEALAYPAARALAAECARGRAARGSVVGSLEGVEAGAAVIATPLAGAIWVHGPGWNAAMLVGLAATAVAVAALARVRPAA